MAFVRQHADDDQQLFSTEIILGELLANTVEHAPGLVEITIDWTGKRPILLVRDGGSGFEVDGKQLPSTALSEDGRGLYLIRSLSDSVAIRPAQGFGSELEIQLPIDKTPNSTQDKRGDPQTQSADDG